MKILVTPTSMQPENESNALNKLRDFSQELASNSWELASNSLELASNSLELASNSLELVFNSLNRPLTEEELIPLLKDCDGFIAGIDFITAKVIASCPKLKVISRYGAGYDRVDIQAAKEAGIAVTNTPGVNAQAVGELTFGLILSLARRIPYLNQQTRQGAWVRSIGMELKGKTLGILGLGAIGKVVARCGQGVGMHIITYDPFVNREYCKEHRIEICSAEEVIKRGQVISLHLPLNHETQNYINKERIKQMLDGVIVINTSRGGLVNEEDAYKALKSGKLGGLGLDAFALEPPKVSPLFALDNVVVTPHTGAHTYEATEQMGELAVKNLIQVLTGKECPYVVN